MFSAQFHITRFLTFIILISFGFLSFGQEVKKINSFSYGPEFRTNGFGISATAAIETKWDFKNTISLSATSLHHHKEVKFQNPNYNNPKPYFYGKLNNAIIISPALGFFHQFGYSSPNQPQFEIGFELGPALAVNRPYYVYVQSFDNLKEFQPKPEKHNPEVQTQQDDILGSAGWNNGFNEMSATIGIKSKINLRTTWNQSYYLQRLNTFFQAEFYPRSMNMLYGFNTTFFASVGFSFEIGKP